MGRMLIAILGLLAAATSIRAQEASIPASEPWRIWARAEYLLWWVRDDRAPAPLVTTGPVGAPRSGALDQAGTSVLVGPDIPYRGNSGLTILVGGWLDSAATIGVEAGGVCLETHTLHNKVYSNRTDGAPVIARPFFNTLTGQQDAQIITGPRDVLGGRYLGGIGIFGDSRTWGGEVNLLFNLANAPESRWDLIGGFRYLGQKDQFRSDQSSTVLAPGTVGFAGRAAPGPDIVSLRDYLETNNSFYGGQVGVQGRFQSGPWNLDVVAKVGLGDNEQHLEALGRTLLTNSAGRTLYQSGGLFVPPGLSSIDRGRLSFTSEVNLRVGYRITERWLASVGYTFLFWGDVIRPGAQINPAVDPRIVPTSLSFNPNISPAPFQLHSTDFWAQGMTVGLEYRY